MTTSPKKELNINYQADFMSANLKGLAFCKPNLLNVKEIKFLSIYLSIYLSDVN